MINPGTTESEDSSPANSPSKISGGRIDSSGLTMWEVMMGKNPVHQHHSANGKNRRSFPCGRNTDATQRELKVALSGRK